MATKQDVLDLYAKYAEWTAVDIAVRLGCNPAYVRATLQRSGLKSRPSINYPPVQNAQPKVKPVPQPDPIPSRPPEDQRDIDILCDLREGHSLRDTADHWGVSYTHVRNLSVAARAA